MAAPKPVNTGSPAFHETSNVDPRRLAGALPGYDPANDNDQADNEPLRAPTVEAAAFHKVGDFLFASAVRDIRNAATAAEVFRVGIAEFPSDPWLHNGLGRALLELAAIQSGRRAIDILAEAKLEFQAACECAEAGSAAHLRFLINQFTTQWQHAEQTGDREEIERSLEALQSMPGLSETSPYWPHVRDNVGNAYMALGNPDAAIPAYEAAIRGWKIAGNAAELARSLNNLGTAYAALEKWDAAEQQYRAALAILTPENAPAIWARTQDNLGRLCLAELQAGAAPKEIDALCETAQSSFNDVRKISENRSQPEWSVSTLNLAISLTYAASNLATHHSNVPDAVKLIHESLDLYKQAVREFPTALLDSLVNNLSITMQLLSLFSQTEETLEYIVSYKYDIVLLDVNGTDAGLYRNLPPVLNPIIKDFAKKLNISPNHWINVSEHDHIIRDILSILRGTDSEEWPAIFAAVQARGRDAALSRHAQTADAKKAGHAATYRPKGDRTLPNLPAGLTWPTETYSGSPEAKRGGGGIVAYLERVWLPVLSAAPGVADLRVLRLIDKSAAKGVDNFTQTIDRSTGKPHVLPSHLAFPTIKQMNDAALAAGAVAVRDAPRLGSAARRRRLNV